MKKTDSAKKQIRVFLFGVLLLAGMAFVKPMTVSASTVIVTASPPEGGVVIGDGIYQNGETVTIAAIANAGWTFEGWYENNGLVSISTVYSFSATSNRIFQARFTQIIVPATSITGVQTTAAVGVPLALTGTVNPANATNKTIVWSIVNAGTTGAAVSGDGTLYTTAAGTVIVRATITNGIAAGTDYTQDFPLTVAAGHVPVTSITGVPTAAAINIPLTLTGTVNPTNATSKTIVWSIQNAGTTGATISGGNTLNTTAVGTVIVRATIANGIAAGTNYTQDFVITASADFVRVTSITGVPTTTAAEMPLTLVGLVNPTNATSKAIVWSVVNAGTTNATISDDILNTTAAGVVTVRATIANGVAAGIAYTQDFIITVTADFMPVTNISAVPTTARVNTPLMLFGTVNPANATNRTIVWSIQNAGATGAAINNGSFTATAAGTVTVTATITNGTVAGIAYTQDFTITVSATAGTGTISAGDMLLSVQIDDTQATINMTAEERAQITDQAEDTVTFDLSAIDGLHTAVLSRADWDILTDERGLALIMPEGILSFDEAAAASVLEQTTSGNILCTISPVNAEDLTEAQRDVIAANDLIFSITVEANRRNISQFDGGLSVTVSYNSHAPASVWKLFDDGTLEQIPAVLNADGTVTFVTNRLSVFRVGYDAPPAPIQPPPGDEPEPALTTLCFIIGSPMFTNNGVSVLGDVAPFIDPETGRTMVPIRAVVEGLGALVDWDDATRTVTIIGDNATAIIIIGQPLADGMGTAVIVNGRTFVPLRYVSEILGADVEWDGENRAVYIYQR